MHSLKTLLFTALTLIPSTLLADANETKPKTWSGDIELGLKFTKGNSNENSLAFRQSLIFDHEPWKNTLHLEADNTQSNGVRTEERYYITEKLDRVINGSTYSFIRGSYEKDLFGGFEYQATYVLGVGHRFLDKERLKLSVETGLGSIYERANDAKQGEHSLLYYLADEFSWQFSASAELGQNATLEYSDINTITRANIFVKSSLTTRLSLRLSYGVKHNSEVAEDKQHTDTEALATLVYGF